jgi:bacillithiol system protein YtxJ
MNWIEIKDISELAFIDKKSISIPQLIFKHSTSCPVSSMAKMRLEKNWDIDIPTYYLDLKAYREISNDIASRYDIHHESPQVLVISNGLCIYDASHLDINKVEIAEALNALAN